MKKILTLFTALLFIGSMVVEAATSTTVYYAVPTSVVGSYTVKLNVNRQGDANNWATYTMTQTNKTYNSNPIYSCTFTDVYDGLGAMQIQLYDGSSWKSQVQPISSWTSVSVYNGKMWVHGSSSWIDYTDDDAAPVPSYTFTSGTTIYYDFTAYSTTGINTYVGGNEAWYASTSNLIAITLSSDWEVTASTKLWRSGAAGWNDYYCTTLPTEGQDMIVSTDGKTYTWGTYGGGVLPPAAIKLHGNMKNPSWADTDEFTLASNEETASLTLTGITKGNYEFGVKIAESWTSNGSAFTRTNNSYEIVAGSSGNCTFNADRNGDYTFTWTYATNTLEITYPAIPAQSVAFNGLAAQTLKGSTINLANFVTSSGIDNPGYRFYIREKGSSSYGSAVSASYTFNALGTYQIKVEALEDNTGEPVAFDEAEVAVYGAHTFTNGTTIYVDFTAMTEGAKGVNYPKTYEPYLDWDGEGAGTFKTITFTADVQWSTQSDFIKTEKGGWDPGLKFSVPEEGQNCAVVNAAGDGFTWATYVPLPPTIKLHGNFLGEWNTTDAFAYATGYETASLTLNIQSKGEKEFGVRYGSDDNWTSNGVTIDRNNTSKEIVAGSGNCKLNVDAKGDYTFTWTYATNTLSVLYPELPAQSVSFDGLAAQVLKGAAVNFADYVTSSGIDNPGYLFYVKAKNGEYGDAVASYTFDALGEYVVKVAALEDNAGEPVAFDEAEVAVYDTYTFTNGTTIYVDFTAMTEGAKGVNYPKTYEPYLDWDGEGAGTFKTITFTADVQWSTQSDFIKTEKGGWDPGLKFSVPEEGQNCAVVNAAGDGFTWATYVPLPPTIKLHGNFLGEWNTTDAFAYATGYETASLTLNIQATGEKEFGVRIGADDNWTSNGASITRANTSAEIISGSGNCTLDVDVAGDYTFTWTYATNTLSVTYPADPGVDPIALIGGKFIINAKGDTAVFSRGNLQYQQSSDTWRCAPNQYEWKGMGNLQMGNAEYEGWVDLFCWSIGAENNYGATSAYLSTDYYNKDFVDWGGLFSGDWSTLSSSEWKYLLNTRPDANDKWGMAMIEDNLGMILLPEEWVAPDGITFVPRTNPTSELWDDEDAIDDTEDHYRVKAENMPANKFTLAQWAELEAAGAVFLPYAGRRSGGYGNHTNRLDETITAEYNYTYYENYLGTYWTSTSSNKAEGKADYVYTFRYEGGEYNWGKAVVWGENGRYGQSVRLTHIIPRKYTVTYNANGAEGTLPTDAAKYLDGAQVTLASAEGLYKEGFVFAGWKFKGVTYDEGADYTISNVLASEEIVFEAQWEPTYVTVRTALETNRYYTICLERNITDFKGATFWSLTYKDQEEATMVYIVEETAPEAGKPYVIQSTADNEGKLDVLYGEEVVAAPVENGALRGTFADIDEADFAALDGTVYLLINNAIRPRTTGNYLSAHRAYVRYDMLTVPPTQDFAPGRRVRAIPMQKDVATGIEDVQRDNVQSTKVLINGQLYILRGEKMYDATGSLVK